MPTCFIVLLVMSEASPFELTPPLQDAPLSSREVQFWLSQAYTYWTEASSSEQNRSIPTMVALLIKLGQERTAYELTCRLKDDNSRLNYFLLFCYTLSARGKVDSAISLADALVTHSQDHSTETADAASIRHRATMLIAIGRFAVDDYEGGIKMVNTIREPEERVKQASQLARLLSGVGLRDKALGLLKETEQGLADKNLVESLDSVRREVQTAQARGSRGVRPPHPKYYLDEIRSVSRFFEEGYAATPRVEIERLPPGPRAAALSDAAWKSLEENDIAAARDAAEKCSAAVRAMSDIPAFHKAAKYLEVADLWWELGELQKAREFAAMGAKQELPGPLDSGLATFTIHPLAVSLYVRLGMLEEAKAMLTMCEQQADQEADNMGLSPLAVIDAFGYTCALTGQVELARQQLSCMNRQSWKAVLCCSVALGIHESARLPNCARPKPTSGTGLQSTPSIATP